MEVSKIRSLDCSIKNNRKLLLEEIKKAIKTDEKPTIKRLEQLSKIIGEKYDMKVKIVKCVKSGMFISYRYEGDSYCTFTSRTYYEALCKYILFIKCHLKDRTLKVK